MKFTKLLIFCFLSTLFSVYGQAQDLTINGKVTDENGLPIPGASILIKGTAKATASDIDGNYQIKAASNGALVYSYVGYKKIEESIKGRTRIDVKLNPEAQTLQEVVVVGYGTQKKSVVTGAISSVKAKDLENVPNGRIEQALQGRVSGLSIAANAGQPGSASTIRIRGITTFSEGGNDPLWVVDGVIVDNGGIGFINQSDIESIEVLKDAASLAIYGSRSAGGVIMVTTKKGKSGKISVNYNGFSGVSSPARVLKLLNATQYGSLQNEASINGGGGILFPNVAALGMGTDWQKAIFSNNAQRYSHELSFSGGNDVSTFFMSFGIQDQQGIVTPQISNFTKKSMRLNSTHKLSKFITIGQSFGYTHTKSLDIGNTNAEQGGPLSSAIHLDPITPLVETDPAKLNDVPYSGKGNSLMMDDNGNPYGIAPFVQNNMTNPLAYIKTRLGNHNWSDDIVGNVSVEITPIQGLKFKSTLGAKLSSWGSESFTPMFYLNGNNINDKNTISRGTNKNFGWVLTNLISYSKKIGEHNFSLLVGQEATVGNDGSGTGVTYKGLASSDYRVATFASYITPDNITAYAYNGTLHKLASIFSRFSYDYKEKYLLTGVIRRDGSTKFGPNNKYGNFPGVSVGWVVSKEGFWKDNKVLNTLKFRGGYGVTGNDAIIDFGYLALVSGGRNYPFGTSGAIQVGNSPDAPSNKDLKWESTTQTNIGMDTKWFNTVNMSVEVYKKKTSGILQTVEIPGFVGAPGSPVGNVADMENRGVELELGFNKKIGELNFRVNGNASYLENEVTYLGQGKTYIDGGVGFQSMGTLTRTEVGLSRNTFYGLKTAGIFQNQGEIDSYKNSTGIIIQPKAKPGDFRWVDTNDDGVITDLDRQNLGSPLPKFTFGFNLSVDYKGFDLSTSLQGVAGNKIFQGLRRIDLGASPNYQTKALGRWVGEGTSNTYPRLTTDDSNHNFNNFSDFYLENGDFLRLKLITLGYSMPTKVVSSIGASKVRFYVTGENLLTFTKYTGYDPEIGGSTFGIDRGYYPQARTFMFGANLQF